MSKIVFEYETKVVSKTNVAKNGKTYKTEYVVIPKSVRGDKTLAGKKVHIKIEVVDDDP